jgi:cysteine desulfurase
MPILPAKLGNLRYHWGMSSPHSTAIYLDHNASTPVLSAVVEAMRASYAEPLLNPASQHEFGRRARRALEAARQRVGELLGAKMTGMDSDQVIFTSGGTEANNLAMLGLLNHEQPPNLLASSRQHLIVSAIEHPSIAALADELSRRGWLVDRLGVDSHGVVRKTDLARLLQPDTQLVAAMLAHNETGVLQPVPALAAICAERGVPLHTDAAQIMGKLPVDFRALGAATMAVAAHKFHGPLGIGALVVRHGFSLRPQLYGGFQQAGLRPGTESVALAIGMCRALEIWHAEQQERTSRLRALRDRFERAIVAGWPSAVVIGAETERLPQTSLVAFVGVDRQALFMALDQARVACSTGSACASGSSEPSPVLVAMGLDPTIVRSALRFSFGATTTASEVDHAVHRILTCCNDLGRQKRT